MPVASYSLYELEYLEDIRALPPLDRLLHWCKERESIRLKKDAGKLPPWTTDPILARYRFTNVVRMDDKVSRWLLHHWYLPHRGHPHMLLAIALARFVNRPESLEPLTPTVFGKSWRAEQLKKLLRKRRERGEQVFNAAYMVRGAAEGGEKIAEVVDDYVGTLKRAKITLDTDSMQLSHARLSAVHGFGSFMAGQVIADARHAIEGKWEDRNSWAPIGPGSRRGMNCLHDRPITDPCKEWGKELRELVIAYRRGLPKTLTDRMEAIDTQSTICEYWKYIRTLLGKGRPKQIYRPANTREEV